MRKFVLAALLLLQLATITCASTESVGTIADKLSRILGDSTFERDKDWHYDHEEKYKPLECKKSGKYEEICAEKEYISKGKWRDQYECYEKAVCEEQFGRKCGFTVTPKLVICLIEVLSKKD